MRSAKRIKPFLKYLEMEWKKNPDLRFGQLLITTGIVSDDIKTWNAEMSDYPIPFEVLRTIQSWGTYGKNNKYKEVLLKDLETSHIKNILKTQTHIEMTPIELLLNQELKFRSKKKWEE